MATRSKPAKASKKSAAIKVDFEGVESNGGTPTTEGDHIIEVEEVERKTSDDSGKDYLSLTLKVAEGDEKGKTLYHNCSLQPQALFNLRGVLEALGFDVPDGVMELDPADMVGERCGVAVAHETYEGKKRARCVEFFPEDEFEERNPDEEPAKPAKGGKVVKKAKPEPEPEEKPAKVTKKKKPAAKEEPEFEVDDKVSFTDDEGNELEGVITEIDDGTFTVKTGKGKKAEEWELEADDLTKVDE